MEVRIEHIKPEFAKDTWQHRSRKHLWDFMECDTPLPATFESEYEAYKRMSMATGSKFFGIIANGVMVGTVKLKRIGHGTSELGYYLLREDFMCKGVMKKAVWQAMEFAFDVLNLDMVYLYVNPRNISSFALALNLGFWSIGVALANPEVQRLEMTRTVYNRIKEQYGTREKNFGNSTSCG
mgnify:CR=1 FL=1